MLSPGPQVTSPHPLDRCGLAALSDLGTPEQRALLRDLEVDQARFLENEQAFRSPDYAWPRDALHWWSRVWEYPYVLHHLRRWREGASARPVVVDLGSGVTFFPYTAARLGCDVVCLDVDPIAGRDVARAAQVTDATPGRVTFRRVEGPTLPLADGEADAVYCISVIEHVPDFPAMVREVARALKPGGLFVVTVDVDLLGGPALGVKEFELLVDGLLERFEPLVPDGTVHPLDVLDSGNGPHPYRIPPFGLERTVRNVVRRIRGRKLRVDPKLAVHGMALRKKA